ncbi:hypothetical protein U1Q18_023335 [Sarracenia purpurea var. burkii]
MDHSEELFLPGRERQCVPLEIELGLLKIHQGAVTEAVVVVGWRGDYMRKRRSDGAKELRHYIIDEKLGRWNPYPTEKCSKN